MKRNRSENIPRWMSTLFIASLIAANIIAVKIIDFWGIYLPAGVIVFPITYIIGDIVTEIYGFKSMKKLIFHGFFANLVVSIFILISIQLSAAPFWENQEQYQLILSSTPRILLASFSGYFLGSLSNSWSMEYIKQLTQGKYLWVRTIGSTIIGEGVDTIIFILIAFTAVFDNEHLVELIIAQWIFKVVFEIVATPLTYYIIGRYKK